MGVAGQDANGSLMRNRRRVLGEVRRFCAPQVWRNVCLMQRLLAGGESWKLSGSGSTRKEPHPAGVGRCSPNHRQIIKFLKTHFEV